MYFDGQKALLMTRNEDIQSVLGQYLKNHYNLEMQVVKGIIELLEAIGEECTYDLIILDENVEGLPVTSHTLKKIKKKYTHTNVLYLSSLLEIADPYYIIEKEDIESGYHDFLEQAQIRKVHYSALCSPIMNARSLDDIYSSVCRGLVETFNVDSAMCIILRLDEIPVTKGIIVADFPRTIPMAYEFYLKGLHRLEELIDYFKPVHIPDLNNEYGFQLQLLDKQFPLFRSILLLPMQIEGNCIGFFGLFTRNRSRLYNLADLDLCQKFADISAVSIITLFALQHGEVKVVKRENRVIR